MNPYPPPTPWNPFENSSSLTASKQNHEIYTNPSLERERKRERKHKQTKEGRELCPEEPKEKKMEMKKFINCNLGILDSRPKEKGILGSQKLKELQRGGGWR